MIGSIYSFKENNMGFVKKISAFAAGLILAGALCGCGNPADNFAPKGFMKISPDNADYVLYVPDSWTADLSTGVTTAYVSAKDRSNISFMAFEADDELIHVDVNVNGKTTEGTATAPVTTDKPETTVPETKSPAETGTETEKPSEVPKIESAEEYWAYYEADFRKTFGDMEYEVNGENVLLSAKAAKKYVYTATVTGQKYKFMQVVMLDKGTVYIYTYTALPDNYDKNLESAEAILGYISVGK